MKIEKREYKILDETTEHICILDINTIEELDEAIEPIMDDIRAHFYSVIVEEYDGRQYPAPVSICTIHCNGKCPDLTKEDIYKRICDTDLGFRNGLRVKIYNYDPLGFSSYWDEFPNERYYPEKEYEIILEDTIMNILCDNNRKKV